MSGLAEVPTERGGKFVQCVKYAMELDGLPAGAVRLPLRPMKKELKRTLREALATARTSVHRILETRTEESQDV